MGCFCQDYSKPSPQFRVSVRCSLLLFFGFSLDGSRTFAVVDLRSDSPKEVTVAGVALLLSWDREAAELLSRSQVADPALQESCCLGRFCNWPSIITKARGAAGLQSYSYSYYSYYYCCCCCCSYYSSSSSSSSSCCCCCCCCCCCWQQW